MGHGALKAMLTYRMKISAIRNPIPEPPPVMKATLSLSIVDQLPKRLSYFLSHIVNQAFAKLLLVEPHDSYPSVLKHQSY